MSNIITFENVTKQFQDGSETITILDNVNFNISQADSIAIIGSSGCGKSTVLNLISGIDFTTAGDIYLENNNLKTISEEKRCILRNTTLGFIYQFHHLLSDFNVVENVMMPLLIQGIDKQNAYDSACNMLDKVNLLEKQNSRVLDLSGGQSQRVAICRALVSNPKCILADEPTGNLDQKNAQNIFSLMFDVMAHNALVVVTHDEAYAKKFFKKIYKIDNAKLVQIK